MPLQDNAGIVVRFEADPGQYARFGEAVGAGPWEAHTDSEGLVETQVSLIEDEAMRERRTTSEVHGRSRDASAGEAAFGALDKEGRKAKEKGADDWCSYRRNAEAEGIEMGALGLAPLEKTCKPTSP